MPCRFGGFLAVAADPETGRPAGQIPWSYPDDPPTVPLVSRPLPEEIQPRTPAQETWWLVQQYYKEQGKGVPPKEAKACLDAIAEEKKPKAPEPEPPRTLENVLGPRPMWGDPEYWNYWRKAKALGLVAEKKKKSPKAK